MKLLRRLRYEYSLISHLGLSGFFALKKAVNGALLEIEIQKKTITIRKGTPDVNVAITNLTGEFESLKYLLDKSFSGVIVDAGGYIGTAAIALSELYPNATVVCIEPSSSNYKLLNMNIENYKNIVAYQKALVGNNDQKSVELSDRNTGHWGYTIVKQPADNDNASVTETIECVTLQNLGFDIDQIGIVKLDIEGAEKELFEEDSSTYEQIPVLIVELHDRIVSGCSDTFHAYSAKRWTIKEGNNEKYLSLKRTH